MTIAADRPEVYVTGGALTSIALNAGIDPDAAALLSARAHTRQLLRLLGVRGGTESLFALYAPYSNGERAMGLATTFSGDFRAPADDSRRDPAIQVFQSHPNGIVNVPIQAFAPQSTIAEQATAQIPPVSNRLLFEIEVDSGARASDVDAGVIVKKLRRVPQILAASAKAAHGGSNVRYAILLPRSDRSAIPALADIVRKPYAAYNPEFSFELTPYVGDCSAFEERLLGVTLSRTIAAARTEAATSKVRLRKLLLVAVAPADEGPLCAPIQRDPGALSAERLEDLPARPQTSPISASSVVVFRTAPQ